MNQAKLLKLRKKIKDFKQATITGLVSVVDRFVATFIRSHNFYKRLNIDRWRIFLCQWVMLALEICKSWCWFVLPSYFDYFFMLTLIGKTGYDNMIGLLTYSSFSNFEQVIATYHWKYGASNLYSMIGFQHKWTDGSKPNVKINMMSPHHSVQMSTQHQIQLWWMCWQQTVPNRYIEVEFNIGYFQWYVASSQCYKSYYGHSQRRKVAFQC